MSEAISSEPAKDKDDRPVGIPADANGKSDGTTEMKMDESKTENNSEESKKPKEEAKDEETGKMEEEPQKEDEKKDESKDGDMLTEAKDAKEAKPQEDKKEETEKEDSAKAGAEDKKRKAEGEEPKDGKRKRKTAAVFKPEDFSQSKTTVNAYKGRGDKLRDLEGVRESIESHSHLDEVVKMAYSFVFATRGKPPMKAKEHLLDFTGYLPEEEEGEDKAKAEERDEELEVCFSRSDFDVCVKDVIFFPRLLLFHVTFRRNIRRKLTR